MPVHSISKQTYILSCLIWFGLPIAIFLLSWIRPIFGIPATVFLCFGIYRVIRLFRNDKSIVVNCDGQFWVALIFILIFTIGTGIGGYWHEDPWDFGFRNAVFRDLVINEWPVYFPATDNSESLLLCYYHLFWLPSALIAKITGSLAFGEFCVFIYAFCGLNLMVWGVMHYINKHTIKLKYLFYIAFFCGWDIVIFTIFRWDGGNVYKYLLSMKDGLNGFSAPTLPILTMFIYNQGIAAWCGVALLLALRKQPSILIFCYSLLFCLAPIPAVGFFPALVYLLCKDIRKSFSIENAIGIVIGLILAIYFMGNNNAQNPTPKNEEGWLTFLQFYIFYLVMFTLFTYGVYLPFVWKGIKRDTLFWILLITASVLPAITLNGRHDFGNRVGVPCIFYLMVFILRSLVNGEIKGWLKKTLFYIVLLIGASANGCMYFRSIWGEYCAIASRTSWRALWLNSVFDKETNYKCYNNFVSTGESLFTKYLMKRTNEKDNVPIDHYN